MSAMTTRTWRCVSKARCSAMVSATRGVTMRSMTGSSAVLSSSASSPRRGALLEGVAHGGGVGVGDAHAGEHDGERFAAGVGLRRDLGRELEMGQPADREDGELLAAHQRGQRVDDRDSGDDRRRSGFRARSGSAGRRSHRRACRRRPAGRRRGAYPGRCTTRPSQASPTPMRIGWPEKRTAVPVVAMPAVPSSTWITARSRSRSRTTPWRSPSARRISTSSSHPTSSTPATTSSGPSTRRMSVYSMGSDAAHGIGERGEDLVALRGHGGDVVGAGVVACRISGGEVDVLEQRGGQSSGDQLEAAVVHGQDGIRDGGLLAAVPVAVVGAQRALLEDGLPDKPAREQDHALAAGKRADPDQVGDRLQAVGLGEQPGKPGPPVGPAGSPLATCHAARPSASRENEERQVTAG